MPKKSSKLEKICPVCKTLFYIFPSQKKNTCSKKCMGINQKGSNNPNFGNKWTDKQKKYLSNLNKAKSSEISARVKKDWENNTSRKLEAAEKMSNTMKKMVGEKNHFYGKTHSEDTKKEIGKKSSAKFTNEFKENRRKTMEGRGHWSPKELKNDYDIYFAEANWISRMFDVVPDNLNLLNTYGVFHAKENTNGVVRDHILGRKYGFEYKVFPEILRHPCNCQILRQRDNVSKGQKGKGRPDSDITLEELFLKIEAYKGRWLEHELVLSLIQEYRKGNRWNRQGGVSNELCILD